MTYLANHIQPFDIQNISTCFHILVIHPDQIPPHIAVLHEKKYFDITHNQCRCEKDLNFYLPILKHKKTLIFTLNKSIPVHLTRKHFSKYTQIPEGETCLLPIKEILSDALPTDFSSVQYIFELIPQLESLNLIKNVYQTNLHTDRFILNTYTQEDIQLYINKLKRKTVFAQNG